MQRTTIILVLIAAAAAGAAFLFLCRGAGEAPRNRPLGTERGGNPPSSVPAAVPSRSGDLVFIEKKARRLTLYRKGKPVRTYRVALGFRPEGRKTADGDGRTPEGSYVINLRKANSRFHKALRISYPNGEDRRRAQSLGVSPGGDIMIHGLANGMGWVGRAHLARDWTRGCIAVTNGEMDELWRLVPVGTPVEIVK